jgi:hypothetical protein
MLREKEEKKSDTKGGEKTQTHRAAWFPYLVDSNFIPKLTNA